MTSQNSLLSLLSLISLLISVIVILIINNLINYVADVKIRFRKIELVVKTTMRQVRNV